ncbi:MAG: DNA-binding protein [Candidatus Thorarchaeota archaeon]
MNDDDDVEFAMLRRKRMAKLIAAEKKHKAEKTRQEQVGSQREKLLSQFLAPDAASYLEAIQQREPPIASRIKEIILYLVTYRQIRQIFKQMDIRYIERQIKGVEPTIKVQRDGETSDLASFVKDAIKKDIDKSKNN